MAATIAPVSLLAALANPTAQNQNPQLGGEQQHSPQPGDSSPLE